MTCRTRLSGLLGLVLLGGCLDGERVSDPGNGSETTNGFRAVVLDKDGIPAVHASVFLRDPDHLEDTAFLGRTPIADATTDDQGFLRLASLPSSALAVEIDHGRGGSLLATIAPSPQRTGVDTFRLQASSALYGFVDRSHLSASARIFVQIRGMDRLVEADSSGGFSFSNLPAGSHRLRILTDRSDYGVAEGDTVRTRPGASRDGGRFALPFEYWRDTAEVRSLLDASGLANLPVDSVVKRNKEGRIVALNLEGRGLTKLPSSIANLRLRNLSIGGNLLDSLPDGIGRIPSLQVLSAHNNRLVFLPGSIGDLPDLRVLDLGGNQLASLPENLTRLDALETLSVAGNRLRDVKAPVSTWLDLHCTDTASGDWRTTQQ